MRSVIRFLNAKNMKPAEILRQFCDVYREHAMSSSMVRRWVRLFNEGRENVLPKIDTFPPGYRPSLLKSVIIFIQIFERKPHQKRAENCW